MTTIRDVVKVMEQVKSSSCWWRVDKFERVLALGVSVGWLHRPSETQVEWTAAGARAAKSAGRNLLHLRCACCGQEALSFRQWWNQDTGWGLCPRCRRSISEKEGAEYVVDCYGRAGVHHSIDIEEVVCCTG